MSYQCEMTYPDAAPFTKGSETSQEAAESINDELGRLEALVISMLQSRGKDGATDDEIECSLGLSHQCASARRRTLVLKGRVCDSGRTRKTRYNRNAVVWVLGKEEMGPAPPKKEADVVELIRQRDEALARASIAERSCVVLYDIMAWECADGVDEEMGSMIESFREAHKMPGDATCITLQELREGR